MTANLEINEDPEKLGIEEIRALLLGATALIQESDFAESQEDTYIHAKRRELTDWPEGNYRELAPGKKVWLVLSEFYAGLRVDDLKCIEALGDIPTPPVDYYRYKRPGLDIDSRHNDWLDAMVRLSVGIRGRSYMSAHNMDLNVIDRGDGSRLVAHGSASDEQGRYMPAGFRPILFKLVQPIITFGQNI